MKPGTLPIALATAIFFGGADHADGAPLSPYDPSRLAPSPPPPASAPLTLPSPPAVSGPRDNSPRLVLEGVSFDGSKAVGASRLAPAWETFRGKSVGLADLRAIGRAAEAIYAKAGYPFVAVLLKPQDVQGGVVHYDVVEGRISDLTILGLDPAARRQATAVLQPLVNRQPLSLADVETAYELAQRVPDLSITGALRRGSQPGGMDLVVDAKRADPWKVYLNVNNLYADPVGPWGVLGGVSYAGSTTFGDEAQFQAYTSIPAGRQVLLRGSYEIGVDAIGTQVGVSALWGKADPKGELAPLALATDIETLRLDVTQPLLERRQQNLIGDLALEASDQRTKVFQTVGLSDDKLRIFSASLAGEEVGRLGHIAGSLEVRQGLDFAGASKEGDPDLSRANGDPEATVWKGAIEAQSVGLMSLNARGEFQYAAQPLTAPDQYTVGNLTIGRGYQPGSALGDSALAGSLELRFGPFKLWRVLQAQPFVFIDAVRLYNHAGAAFDQRTLTSAGAGVRWEISGKAHVDLVYAVPQTAPLGLGQRTPSPTLLLNMTLSVDDAFAAIHRRIAHGVAK